jgi:hypothetical protein
MKLRGKGKPHERLLLNIHGEWTRSTCYCHSPEKPHVFKVIIVNGLTEIVETDYPYKNL